MACTDFVTVANLNVRYAALMSAIDPAIVTDIMDCMPCEFRADKWGCRLYEGSLMWSVHSLKMAHAASQSVNPGSVGGTISGMSQGPVSVSFSVPSGGDQDAWYSQTTEGQKYLSMRSLVSAGCGVSLRAGGRCVAF